MPGLLGPNSVLKYVKYVLFWVSNTQVFEYAQNMHRRELCQGGEVKKKKDLYIYIVSSICKKF